MSGWLKGRPVTPPCPGTPSHVPILSPTSGLRRYPRSLDEGVVTESKSTALQWLGSTRLRECLPFASETG